jgi:DNA primase
MSQDKPDITTILEYYGARVPTRSGWAKLKCPFHDDSHASAAVNLKENIFKCHGCQYKGDAYAIIMQKEGVNFREAITLAKRIFDQSGKVLPQRTARSGGLPRRTGDLSGASPADALGRRARAAHGS